MRLCKTLGLYSVEGESLGWQEHVNNIISFLVKTESSFTLQLFSKPNYVDVRT